ncbi:MAG: BrxA/BrxB family bacilliredoxin [Planctomycetes bacterium]|nr:BrxA/BrxB family bacilliredoxin [Planctomycetota bacterium]
MYDPDLVKPMREEVTSLGASELLTPADVDKVVAQPGTTLIFVNSVCGCAAGGARPALRLSMMNKGKKPDRVVTVFAGMETAAVERAREFFKPYRPSSPQIALMKDGKLVKMIQRQDIEGRQPQQIAETLAASFNEFC